MLEDTLKQQLQEYLQRITHPVDIIATLDASDSAREMKELLEDIASLSTLVSLRSDGTSERTEPANARHPLLFAARTAT
jgi:alkyl hydroperoxide reductase subunit F